jgi:putative transposase
LGIDPEGVGPRTVGWRIMASTLTSILVHVIYSTKERAPLIDEAIEPALLRYTAGIGESMKSPMLASGAASDHVHLLLSLAKTEALSDVVMHVKKGSSRWIKEQGRPYADFAWQDGYAAFSIGQSQVPNLRRYFSRQRSHHARVSFQDEVRAFLNRYQIGYDEMHVWG